MFWTVLHTLKLQWDTAVRPACCHGGLLKPNVWMKRWSPSNRLINVWILLTETEAQTSEWSETVILVRESIKNAPNIISDEGEQLHVDVFISDKRLRLTAGASHGRWRNCNTPLFSSRGGAVVVLMITDKTHLQKQSWFMQNKVNNKERIPGRWNPRLGDIVVS